MNIDDNNPGQEREQEVDRWLDEAVSQFAKAEPRPGLEGRVLARVAEARRESRPKLRWWGAMALSGAAVLVVVSVWLARVYPQSVPRTPVAKVAVPKISAPPSTKESNAVSEQWVDANAKRPPRVNRPVVVPQVVGAQGVIAQPVIAKNKPNRGVRTAAIRPSTPPKLGRFPSPQPLSEQERTLMTYVERYPHTAALIAQSKAETLLGDSEDEAPATLEPSTDSTE